MPALFEGVVTGAADGYYRISEKPAATLLHLAPGVFYARLIQGGASPERGDHAVF